MAKHKRSDRHPQARHGQKSKPSQHDKRSRLSIPNLLRRRTTQASVALSGGIAMLAAAMGRLLDRRIAFRLPILLAGAMLAGGRRTVGSWLRCAGVQEDWDRFYDLLQTIGKQAAALSSPLLWKILERFDPGEHGYWRLALDDSPTKRYGRHVEGANIHHNPTPGPGDGNWLFGHNWVCIAMILCHPIFGTIALPLLSLLYVRQEDMEKVRAEYDWVFRTKHQLALELCQSVMRRLRALGSRAGFIVVFDGAYVASRLVRALLDEGAIVVSRLRSDAKLFDLPVNVPGKRGRRRKYGNNRIYLSVEFANREGWETISYSRRGVMTEARCKTFLATSHITGGAIRVVLLEHPGGKWAAYFGTDVSMSVEMILQTVSDRWAIEEHFHDVKEIWGAGQQQVRNIWSNIACWNLCGWLYAMVELECWDTPSEELVDRRDRPWDNPTRRPSHNDRRRQIIRKMLRETLLADLPHTPENAKIHDRFEDLLALAV